MHHKYPTTRDRCNHRSSITSLPRFVGSSLLVAGLMIASGNAFAVLLDADLVASGSVELSTTIGQSTFSDGNVTQSGLTNEIRIIQGGVTTSGAFSTTPGTADGADDGTTVLPPTNPLSGALTDTGDGVGFTTDLNAAFATGFNFNEGFDFIIDASIDLTNSSAVNTYTVTIRVDFSNVVDADGDDAFAEVGMDVELDNVDQVLSDVTSDTLLGDSLNGVLTGTSGNMISDINIVDFVVNLAPLASRQVTNLHQWEGGVFDNPGGAFVDISTDITILDFTCTGPTGAPCDNGVPVPEPGTVALLGLGLTGLVFARRRRKQTSA